MISKVHSTTSSHIEAKRVTHMKVKERWTRATKKLPSQETWRDWKPNKSKSHHDKWVEIQYAYYTSHYH